MSLGFSGLKGDVMGITAIRRVLGCALAAALVLTATHGAWAADREVLRAASGSVLEMLEARSRAAATTVAPPAAPILVPGPLVIDREVTLVGLHLIVDGSVIITPEGSLNLYGTKLEVRDTDVRQRIYDEAVQPRLNEIRSAEELAQLAWYDAYWTAYTALYPYHRLPDDPPAPPAVSGPLAEAGAVIRDNVVAQRIVVTGALRTFDLAEYEGPLGLRFDPRRSSIVAHVSLAPQAAPTYPVQLVSAPAPGSDARPVLQLSDTDLHDVTATLAASDAQLRDVTMTTTRQAHASSYPLTYTLALWESRLEADGLLVDASSLTNHHYGVLTRDSSVDIDGSEMRGPENGGYTEGARLETSDGGFTDTSITNWSSGLTVGSPREPVAVDGNSISTQGYWWGAHGIRTYQDPGTAAIALTHNEVEVRQWSSVALALSHQDQDASTGALDVTDNVVTLHDDSWGVGLSVWTVDDGRVTVAGNEISGDGRSGISVSADTPEGVSAATLAENRVTQMSSVGLSVNQGTVRLQRNQLDDNDIGISVPHEAAPSVPLMTGNTVNGINVDGALRPHERVYFYRANGAAIAGRTMTSGARGATTMQGLLTFYDSTGIAISGATLRGNVDGIHLVNSSGTVSSSLLSDHRSVGLRSDASSFTITTTTATRNPTGLSIRSGLVTRPVVSNSAAVNNGVGIHLDSIQPDLLANDISSNGTGLQLWAASPTLKGSTIDRNGYGIQGHRSSPRLERTAGGVPVTISNSSSVGFSVHEGAPVLIGTRIRDGGRFGMEIASAAPVLSQVEITGNDSGGISMWEASASISDSRIAENRGAGWHTYGIIAYSGSSPTVERTRITNNGDYGVAFFSGGSAARVTQSCISGHSAYGLYNEGGAPIDAQRNWWGSSTGPSGRGPGVGDAVSDRVDFANFQAACPA
ncbi:MAG TPA: right-handed parallel beta-helix repeat-containing protein [Actinomycetota bacterium]|nr:right-handed parallel beta-helix repeat-containing protein [Actinomycetota bacterium]